MAKLPPMAAYPPAMWRRKLSTAEWEALQDAWVMLLQAHESFSPQSLSNELTDENSSLIRFLTTFAQEATPRDDDDAAPPRRPSTALRRATYQLVDKLISLTPASPLDRFEFVTGFARIYPRRLAAPVLARAFASPHAAALESSLAALRRTLVTQLEAGVRGDLALAEARLAQLNPLLHASPEACGLFLAGDDFVDGLIAGYRVMNPPLRRVIIATLYLGLVGLAEPCPGGPRWSMLSDRLFSLAAAADEHRRGPVGAGDSLVPALVSLTPLLRVLLARAEASAGSTTETLRRRVAALETFGKGAVARRPKKLMRNGKLSKGKGPLLHTREDADDEMHVHRLSQITQVQDLFPDLGAGFVAKCLEEYGEDVEQVVANLLSETLPPHLAAADRSQGLCIPQPQLRPDLAPRPTPPPQLPSSSQLPLQRRNIYDDDELDRLAVDSAKLSFGKRPDATADQLLQDRPAGPATKAAILSALAAFDSDDDERDDTYDAADVGGTVDAPAGQEEAADGSPHQQQRQQHAHNGEGGQRPAREEEFEREAMLFAAHQSDPALFERSATTRRSAARGKLREATGMTDEAIEGWSLMLARDPARMRRLETRCALGGGRQQQRQQQTQLGRTAWRATKRADSAESGAEESEGGNDDGGGGSGDRGWGGGGGGRRAYRGSRGGGRGRGRGGSVAGPTGDSGTESARRRKEANKSSRANHDRKAGRAKKMARGGLAG